jgi:hypothetical protein
LQLIGLAASGEDGARLPVALGMSVSPGTPIQRVRQTQLPFDPILSIRFLTSGGNEY